MECKTILHRDNMGKSWNQTVVKKLTFYQPYDILVCHTDLDFEVKKYINLSLFL